MVIHSMNGTNENKNSSRKESQWAQISAAEREWVTMQQQICWENLIHNYHEISTHTLSRTVFTVATLDFWLITVKSLAVEYFALKCI
jgi:hypothetical protein